MRGRLAPDAMFPAGVADIRVRRTTLPSGVTLRVAEPGDTSAPPVVLLHGWGASLYTWRAWFAPLAAAGFRAVAIDLLGYGLSDKPEEPGVYGLERQVELLREFVIVEHLEKLSMVAQSMGGTIALELAIQDGPLVGKLVLVNFACFGRAGLIALARTASPTILRRVLARFITRWIVTRAHRLAYAQPSRITRADVDEYWALSQFPAYAHAMRQVLHDFTWQREPANYLARRLRLLAPPPLVVLGGRDKIVRDAASFVAALQHEGALLVVHEIEEAGHAANEEQPDSILRPVIRFLENE